MNASHILVPGDISRGLSLQMMLTTRILGAFFAYFNYERDNMRKRYGRESETQRPFFDQKFIDKPTAHNFLIRPRRKSLLLDVKKTSLPKAAKIAAHL